MSSIKQLFVLKNNVRIMMIELLNLTIVTGRFKIDLSCVTFGKLLLEQLKVLLFDRKYSSEHVPVNIGVARGSSYRSFIHPSVIHVNKHHQVPIWYERNMWLCISAVPL